MMLAERSPRSRAWRVTLDLFRMSHYAAIAAALYFIVFDKAIGLQESNPGLQATIYTLANITVRAWAGYWIARGVLGRLKLDGSEPPDPPMAYLARAVLIGAVILTSK